jgi:hypothetical protein
MSTMKELRATLMATLNDLRDREHPMDVDRAKAVAQIAGVLVETAKVEVDYIKATGGKSDFIEQPQALPAGVLGITQHRIRG